jgi:DNA-directed RNA polymerase specialized sigma24 family protein
MQAEDVLQDGFITLFSKLSDYKGEGSLKDGPGGSLSRLH